MATLVRSGPSEDDLDTLQARLAARETELDEREAELTRLKADLAAFRIRYRQEVGRLHEELEELDRAIAELELGEMAKRLEEEAPDQESATPGPSADNAPRYTSDGVRRLFRDVAKAIHPDLARDAITRDRRHTLMVEANRAYALGDEERLRRILHAWENSPEAVIGDDPGAVRLRLGRRIAQLEEQLTLCEGEIAELHASPLWTLKAMVDEAAAKGKDLIADQVRRLKRDVLAARNRLDAMRWNP